jgi:hypothetical protein
MKAIDTPGLMKLDEEAQRLNYSRQIDIEAVKLDPNGIHLLRPFPAWVGPFQRCQVWMKSINGMAPVEAIMDVSDDSYNKLQNAHNYKAAVSKRTKVRNQLDQLLEDNG